MVHTVDCSQFSILSVSSSRSSALRYGLPSFMSVKTTLGTGAVGEKARKIERLTAARVQEAWQEFHAFYHSLIKKRRW